MRTSLHLMRFTSEWDSGAAAHGSDFEVTTETTRFASRTVRRDPRRETMDELEAAGQGGDLVASAFAGAVIGPSALDMPTPRAALSVLPWNLLLLRLYGRRNREALSPYRRWHLPTPAQPRQCADGLLPRSAPSAHMKTPCCHRASELRLPLRSEICSSRPPSARLHRMTPPSGIAGSYTHAS
jgi:hypothetical protein